LDDLASADKDAMNMIEELIISIHNEPNSKSNGTIIVATTSAGGHSVNKLLLEMSKNSLVSRDSLTSDDILSVLAADQVTRTDRLQYCSQAGAIPAPHQGAPEDVCH
jgi:hypothetical protein